MIGNLLLCLTLIAKYIDNIYACVWGSFSQLHGIRKSSSLMPLSLPNPIKYFRLKLLLNLNENFKLIFFVSYKIAAV